MQIVIPMTGNGSRFKAAGYDRLKPFIEVHGTPMIEWVRRMFDVPDADITFVCRAEHLETLDYVRPELTRIAPKARILAIEGWEKKGPVADVLRIVDRLDADRDVLVSYCDYYMHWDFAAFARDVRTGGHDGAVPCYSGFHPHLLPETNLYASCKVDDRKRLIEIREKFSWTADKTRSHHSPGVYYFRTAALMATYFERLVSSEEAINGEYYASMPYNFMVQDGRDVWCPANVTHFCQWGTPEDLKAYLGWVETIRAGRKRATS